MQPSEKRSSTFVMSWFRPIPIFLICMATALLLVACTADDEEAATDMTPAAATSSSSDDGQPSSADEATASTPTGEGTEPTAEEPEPPVIDEKGLTVYFPRLAPFDEPVEVVTIDTRGPLALDERGCLRLGDESGDVIIWPPDGFTVDVIDGEVTLIDEVLDLPVARVGEWIALGGERGVPRPRDVMEGSREAVESAMDHPLPEACADADGYVFPGGEPGGGIQRVDPDPALAEIEGWN